MAARRLFALVGRRSCGAAAKAERRHFVGRFVPSGNSPTRMSALRFGDGARGTGAAAGNRSGTGKGTLFQAKGCFFKQRGASPAPGSAPLLKWGELSAPPETSPAARGDGFLPRGEFVAAEGDTFPARGAAPAPGGGRVLATEELFPARGASPAGKSAPLLKRGVPLGAKRTPLAGKVSPLGRKSAPLGREDFPAGTTDSPHGRREPPLVAKGCRAGESATPRRTESHAVGRAVGAVGASSSPPAAIRDAGDP